MACKPKYCPNLHGNAVTLPRQVQTLRTNGLQLGLPHPTRCKKMHINAHKRAHMQCSDSFLRATGLPARRKVLCVPCHSCPFPYLSRGRIQRQTLTARA